MNDTDRQRHEARKQEEVTRAGLKQVKVAIDALTNQVNAYRNEQKDGDAHKWPKRTAVAAITYTAITAVILFVSAYQAYLVRSNNVVAERAFISFGFPPGPVNHDASAKPLSLSGISDILNGGGGITSASFISDVTNSGNTPTKNLKLFMKCVPSNERLLDPWKLLYQGAETPIKTPQFIGPHATAQMACGFSGDQIRAIAKGTMAGYVMVDATYNDRLSSDQHRTESTIVVVQVQFGTAVESNGSLGIGLNVIFQPYGAHNCADEECPPD